MNEVNDLGENQTVTRAPDVTVRNRPNKLISFGCHGALEASKSITFRDVAERYLDARLAAV
jgi:hypothetical protein